MKQIKQLKEFQKTGVKFLTDRQTALLADDMGLGKTVQVAAAIERLKPKRTLIICPATLKINWERELNAWISYDYTSQIIYKRSDIVDKNANIIIINYDLVICNNLKKQLESLDYDIMVLDEAHCLSNMETQRTNTIYSNSGLIRRCKRVFALTGTPVRNRPKDFYVTLKVLAPECIEPYTDYESYANRYCGAYYDGYGKLNDKGASNIEELAEKIKPFMLRRTKEEVLPELPPLIEKTIELELTQEIQDVLDNEAEMEESINEYAPNSELGVQATTRRLLGMAKLPQIFSYIKTILETEEKIVIFAYHRDVIDAIRTNFKGMGCRVVQGGINAKLKQMEVDLFIKDSNSRIFIGQYTSAGFGVDGLQKVANNVIFAEIDWVPGNMDQARDRLRRIGQKKPVIAHYLVVPETLEDNMLQTVLRKKQVISCLMSDTEKKKKKEEKVMTLEQSLERVAVALEELVKQNAELKGVLANVETCSCECNNEPVKAEEPKKAKTTKKKAEPKTEPVAAEPVASEPVETQQSVDDLLGVTAEPVAAEVVYTIDDIRTKCSTILSTGDKATNVAKITEIFKKYGYSKITEIQQKDFTNVMNDLQGVA